MESRTIALAFVFIWFLAGGIGHFVATDYFLKIMPPDLPLRLEAVYISGFFGLLGAAGLLHIKTRRAAGIGLIALTVAVTPANIYMWLHPQLFPQVSELLLALRLPLQIVLLACIWWATRPRRLMKG